MTRRLMKPITCSPPSQPCSTNPSLLWALSSTANRVSVMAILLKPATVERWCPNRIHRSCISNDARCRRPAGAPTPAASRPGCSSAGIGPASCRGLGVLDLDRRSSLATPFLLGAPMKFLRVDDHYGILLVVSALMQASQQKHRNKHKC